MNRVVKDPVERRNELITTAQKLFYSKGYERTSVNDIIKVMDVAKGTFYHYFDSKQAVLEAVVDRLTEHLLGMTRKIIADASLDAIEKWHRAFQLSNNWKVENKADMLALMRIMFSDGNVRLMDALQKKSAPLIAHEFAKVIRQGVAEGVFDTPYPDEAAENILSIQTHFSNAFADLILNPEQSDDRLNIAIRKFKAAQDAVERVVGAEPGSLPLLDEEDIAPWFTE